MFIYSKYIFNFKHYKFISQTFNAILRTFITQSYSCDIPKLCRSVIYL